MKSINDTEQAKANAKAAKAAADKANGTATVDWQKLIIPGVIVLALIGGAIALFKK